MQIFMVIVEHLTKRFGEKVAVDNVSFSVGKGEIVGFLGPNGAGKTTTMRLLAGYLSPDEGRIEIDGKELVGEQVDVLRKIGYMPELNPLYRDMLVADFLDFSAELKNIHPRKRKKAFDFVVSSVGIGDVFYQPIRTLSKGYRQRVGLAAALLHNPKVLILDEPTEGLDPQQRRDLRTLIKKLAKDRTIFVSTHVLQEAQAVSNRIFIIKNGTFVADGTPDELMQQAKPGRLFSVDVEGKNVVSSLKNIDGVEHVAVESEKGERAHAIVRTDDKEIRPALSKLAHEKEWMIWEIHERIAELEDVFGILTSRKEDMSQMSRDDKEPEGISPDDK